MKNETISNGLKTDLFEDPIDLKKQFEEINGKYQKILKEKHKLLTDNEKLKQALQERGVDVEQILH
ncbi:MAG: hypothetical protein OXE99_06575 [Cellvibrionales bacterium]|nr:hypothetical protein [Cellvibrionales bacterium]